MLHLTSGSKRMGSIVVYTKSCMDQNLSTGNLDLKLLTDSADQANYSI